MATLDLGGTILGDLDNGPKVIIPLVGEDSQTLLGQARQAGPLADLIEWRVDAFDEPLAPDVLSEVAGRIRQTAGKPLIATVRTAAEGGDFTGNDHQYPALVAVLARIDAISAVDVEAERLGAPDCIAAAKALGTPVIASYHDFSGTPGTEQMQRRLADMEAMGAQVAKLAVMAHTPADTAALLMATARRHEQAGVPLLTMAMGPVGVVSRAVGHLFGSCATFAALDGQSSAPGQPGVAALRSVLSEFSKLEGSR